MATSARTAPEAGINPWIIAISVMLGTFMEVLDTTVVNVSLPHIAGSLGATVDEATWVLTSYLVANAIILPMTGWLANQFGRKNILMLSVGGFTLSSIMCGIAPSLPFLIFFRVIQGATGGGLQPLSQAILLESFPPEGRGKAMAFWALGIVVALALLHQRARRYRGAHHVEAFHLGSSLHRPQVSIGGLLGNWAARGWHRFTPGLAR
jgi:DHA2 family multidrug resistance protein